MVEMPGEPKEYTAFQGKYKADWKAGKITAPTDVRPEAEDPKWYLDWCQYIYGQYCNDYTLITPGGFLPSMYNDMSIAELRAFGRGKHDTTKMMGRLDTKSLIDKGGQKKGLMNISKRPTGLYVKFRNIIIDRLLEVEHEPGIVAIDGPSVRKKQLAKMRDKLAAMPQSKEMFQELGMKPEGVNEDIMQMGPTDVDVLEQLGGYQTLAEMIFREATQASIQFSNYAPEIQRQLAEDVVDAGICATHIKHDAATGKQMIEYVDVGSPLIIPQSQYDDMRDMDYGAFIKPMSISALRQHTDLTESQLMIVAKQYKGIGGNAAMNVNFDSLQHNQRQVFAQRYNGQPYDQFQVQVMTLYFTALDVERYIVGYHECGNYICDKVSRESKLKPKQQEKGKEVRDNIIQYVYKVQWIVGSEMVFNFGVDDIVTRQGTPGAMRAVLPIAVYRSNQPSVTYCCVAPIEDLQLAIFKKRHALTVTPPLPNVAVDLAIMEDSIKLGQFELSPLDMTEIYQISGYYFYHSKSEFASAGEASNRPPIMPLGSDMANYLVGLQAEIENCVNTIRLTCGVSEMADGSGNAKDVLNKVAAGMDTGSNRSLSSLHTAMVSHYKSMVKLLALRYQALCAYGERDLHYLPVGATLVHNLKLYPEFSLVEMDISVRPGVDSQSRQMLMQALITNRNEQKVDEHIYLMVLKFIQQGNLDRAGYVLAKGVADKSARDQQQQVEMMKAQSEAQGAASVQAEQATQATYAMEGDIKSKQIVLQAEEARKTQELTHKHRMEELQFQAGLAAMSAA